MISEDRAARMATVRKVVVAVGFLLLAVAVISVALRGSDLTSLAGLGYPGVAILMFLSSSTVLLPAPGFAGVLAAGAVWNPLLVGIAAGLGSATGELSGYFLGAGGGALLHAGQGEKWKRAHRWLERHGFLALVALAAIPNPFFDAMGLVAGSLAYPMRRFWLACLLGNTLKYVALATLASSATGWFVR